MKSARVHFPRARRRNDALEEPKPESLLVQLVPTRPPPHRNQRAGPSATVLARGTRNDRPPRAGQLISLPWPPRQDRYSDADLTTLYQAGDQRSTEASIQSTRHGIS